MPLLPPRNVARKEPTNGRSSDTIEIAAPPGRARTRTFGGEPKVDRMDFRSDRGSGRRQNSSLVVGCLQHQLSHDALWFWIDCVSDFDRRRYLGTESPGDVGLGDYQLRLVDRYRSRRDP